MTAVNVRYAAFLETISPAVSSRPSQRRRHTQVVILTLAMSPVMVFSCVFTFGTLAGHSASTLDTWVLVSLLCFTLEIMEACCLNFVTFQMSPICFIFQAQGYCQNTASCVCVYMCVHACA